MCGFARKRGEMARNVCRVFAGGDTHVVVRPTYAAHLVIWFMSVRRGGGGVIEGSI